MSHPTKPKYLPFRVLNIVGLLLGLISLGQALRTYWYVSGNLIRQEALREGERKVAFLARSARAAGMYDAAHLVPILDELRHELPARVMWVRILNLNGSVLAESGNAIGAPYTPGKLRQALADREQGSDIRQDAGGKVLIAVFPLRLGRASAARDGVLSTLGRSSSPVQRVPNSAATETGFDAPPRPAAAELGINLNGISVPFGRLRQNLTVSCSAAIALLASMIIIALRFGDYLRGKQLEQQMELARRVQRDLLTSSGCALSDNLESAAECIPAWEVGGDFYDAFADEQSRIAFVLGDVSGKGLAAALLMGVIHGAIRSSDWTRSASNHERSTHRLNELLCSETARERFASLFWCCYEPDLAVLRYVNAGHLPPMLVHRNLPGDIEVERLSEGGPVLGVLPIATYRSERVLVRPGDLLIIFSDGIVEALDPSEEEFGEERLLAVIRDNWDNSPAEISNTVLAQVRSFTGNDPPQDDQTLMVVRLQPVCVSRAAMDTEFAGEVSRARRLENSNV